VSAPRNNLAVVEVVPAAPEVGLGIVEHGQETRNAVPTQSGHVPAGADVAEVETRSDKRQVGHIPQLSVVAALAILDLFLLVGSDKGAVVRAQRACRGR